MFIETAFMEIFNYLDNPNIEIYSTTNNEILNEKDVKIISINEPYIFFYFQKNIIEKYSTNKYNIKWRFQNYNSTNRKGDEHKKQYSEVENISLTYL